jgi:hypothetical protein
VLCPLVFQTSDLACSCNSSLLDQSAHRSEFQESSRKQSCHCWTALYMSERGLTSACDIEACYSRGIGGQMLVLRPKDGQACFQNPSCLDQRGHPALHGTQALTRSLKRLLSKSLEGYKERYVISTITYSTSKPVIRALNAGQ